MPDHRKTKETALPGPGSTKRAWNIPRVSKAEVKPESQSETPTFILCDDLRDSPAAPTVKVDEIDFFFHRQADVFAQYNANLPILESMLSELRERVATMEVQVEYARPATTTWQDQRESIVFRWYAVSTILDALDAYCWGCPWTQSAHGVYENWRAVHTAGALEMFSPAWQDAFQHLCRQPRDIRDTYLLLTTEKGRWDRRRQNFIDQYQVQIKDPPISLRVFFKLCKELGISSQLQLEMAATEKPNGGSFFVW
ncbi:hypothetical protein C8R44DRAFT_300148 [Mycena epipterygia]|nr:hypothetical protein C8R44DRAFT_300148 [Mycena epipterygia]